MHVQRRIQSTTVLALTLSACAVQEQGASESGKALFTDTLAVVGLADEANSLFVYAQPSPAWLVDPSTIVFSDGGHRPRLIVADMITGEGWERVSGPGDAGPGEFDGQQPLVFQSGQTIHTYTASGIHAEWSPSGSLLASGVVDPQAVFGFRTELSGFPVGVANGGIVSHFRDQVEWSVDGPQELGLGIRIVDITSGLITDLRDGMPRNVVEVERHDDGSRSTREIGDQDWLLAAARHDRIVHAVAGSRDLVVREADGVVLDTLVAGSPIRDVRLDRNGRTWLQIDGPSDSDRQWAVYGVDLGLLFVTTHCCLQDAANDVSLSLSIDRETDLLTMALVGR